MNNLRSGARAPRSTTRRSTPSSTRALRAILALGSLALALVLPAASASAANPPANIPLGGEPPACANESSAECESWLVGRLDAARASLGLAGYQLPSDFLTLSADKQLLILSNLDRIAYGFTPISGLNAALREAAAAGVRNSNDPRPPSSEGPWEGFGSDWASTGALLAYYLWMYDDGWEGPNADCTGPSASGCWGHRRVILGEGLDLPQPEVLGAATAEGSARPEGTALIVSSHPSGSTYYTWAQALSEGAAGGGGGGESKGGGEEKAGGEEKGGGESKGGGGEKGGGESKSGGQPPPAPCTRIIGQGVVRVAGLSSAVLVDELTTNLLGRERLEGAVRVRGWQSLRLTGLTQAACATIAGGHEFRGVGPARLNGKAGYTVSFSFAVTGSGTTLSLEVMLGSSRVYAVSGALMARGSVQHIASIRSSPGARAHAHGALSAVAARARRSARRAARRAARHARMRSVHLGGRGELRALLRLARDG